MSLVSKTSLLLYVLPTIAVLMAAAVLYWYALHFGAEPSGTHGRWGEFGDYVGGLLNPGIAFLALLALVWTIHLQTRELRESVSSFSRQTFERTFFEMVRLHNDITKDLHLYRVALPGTYGVTGDLSGRQCFSYYLDELKQRYALAEGESELEKTQTRVRRDSRQIPARLGSLLSQLLSNLEIRGRKQGPRWREQTILHGYPPGTAILRRIGPHVL